MKLFLNQRITSWLECVDVFDEIGRKVYSIKGEKSWGRKLKIYDAMGRGAQIATLSQTIADFPNVDIKHETRFVGTARKLKSIYDFGFLDWYAAGDFSAGSFRIFDGNDRVIANVGTEYRKREEVHVIDVLPDFVLHALTFALAIDLNLFAEAPRSHAARTAV